jgi:hypothetical protein
MKQFGIILLRFGLAMTTSCAGDKSENDPIVPPVIKAL